jgi:hypothetical protein
MPMKKRWSGNQGKKASDELAVVDLEKGNVSNRQRLREFLLAVIAQESSSMLQQLEAVTATSPGD